ncbi:MAG: efflux RND transporter permease subunit, partial [Desulfobacterales bacterium]|nr:efflux RND transporter permease subunit [Desulfobacterales bacterium]
FGMLPLVFFPGAGSEFYRGLGSVIVGGLLFSTVFTIFLIPALLSLALGAAALLRERVTRRRPEPAKS